MTKAQVKRKLKALAREAESGGQGEVASVLLVLLGSLEIGSERALMDECARFAERMIKTIEKTAKAINN